VANKRIKKKQASKDSLDEKVKIVDSMADDHSASAKSYSNLVPHGSYRQLDDNQIQQLDHDNHIAHMVITMPATDMTRNGWAFTSDNEDLDDLINQKLKDLNSQNVFAQFLSDRLKWGDSFIAIGGIENQKGDNPSIPLDPDALLDVQYIQPFDRRIVGNIITNLWPFSPTYGKEANIQVSVGNSAYDLENGTQTENGLMKTIDASRYMHAEYGRDEGDDQGHSLFETIFDALKLVDTANWSVGQIMNDLSFKTYSSNSIDTASADPKQLAKLSGLMNYQFTTESLALIGQNDEVAKVGTQLTGVDSLISFMWDNLSAATNIPKTVLLGQQSGKVSGTQTDVQNYYSYIKSQQENILRPYLERLVRLLLKAKNVGNVDPNSIDWQLNFNPLWEQDSLTNAQTSLAKAQGLSSLVQCGALSPDEAHDAFLDTDKDNATNAFTGDSADNVKSFEELTDSEKNDLVKKYNGESQKHKSWFKKLFK
jgi:phage-related protein (TIGR01555 family)